MRFQRLFAVGVLTAAASVGRAEPLPPLDVGHVTDAPGLGSDGSVPSAFRLVGGRVYFAASTPEYGSELYATDGTPGGVARVADFAPGTASSAPKALGVVNGRLIAEATVPGSGTQAWSVDAAGATVRLTATASLPAYEGTFVPVADLGPRSMFAVNGDASLWSTDGTPGGTIKLTANSAFPVYLYGGAACRLGTTVVFAGTSNGDGNSRLVVSDGTVAGSRAVADLGNRQAFAAVAPSASAGRCYFVFRQGSNWSLWGTDGTVAGTREFAAQAGEPRAAVLHNGSVYLSVVSGSAFRVVRRIAAPTGLVDVVFEGPSQTAPLALRATMTSVGGSLVFVGSYEQDGSPYSGLFVGNGQPGSARRVAEFQQSYGPGPLFDVGGAVAYEWGGQLHRVAVPSGAVTSFANDERFVLQDSVPLGAVRIGRGNTTAGLEVVTTDATLAGTVLLHDIWQTTQGSFGAFGLAPGAAVGDVVVLPAPGGGLLRTDGTTAGTRVLPGSALGGGLVRAIVRGPRSLFVRTSEGSYEAMFRTDADLGGATALASSVRSASDEMAAAGDGVVLLCERWSNGRDLCAIGSGDTAIQSLVLSFSSDPDAFRPIGRLGDVAIFFDDPTQALWRTDGTMPGTFALSPGQTQNARPQGRLASAELGGKLHFVVCPTEQYCELRATDGSVAGTTVVASLPAIELSGIASTGRRIVFVGSGVGVAEMHLWSSDGTPEGTGPIRVLPPVHFVRTVVSGGLVHVVGEYTYWVSDGTVAGTRTLTPPAPFAATGDYLFGVGDAAVVFSCRSQATGVEPCAASVDGTSMRLLRDLYSGPTGSGARWIGTTLSAAYVVADDGRRGNELWRVGVSSEAIFRSGFD